LGNRAGGGEGKKKKAYAWGTEGEKGQNGGLNLRFVFGGGGEKGSPQFNE